MDFKQLRTLVHVAELGSLSKASLRLGIAQPALGRQIKLLEEELGAPLFERHGRGMIATPAGRDVVERAGRILRDIEQLRTLARPTGSHLVGSVAVGTTPTVGEVVTVPLVSRLKHAHPLLSVRVSSAFSGHLLDWVKRGDLDFAVVYELEPTPLLEVVPLMIEDLLLIGPASAGLSLQVPAAFHQLGSEALVLPSPVHGLRKIVDAHAARAGLRLSPSVEADSFNALISLVKHGFGKTLLPLAPIYEAVRNGLLSAAPLIDPTPDRRVVLAFPSDRARSPAAQMAADILIDVAANLVRDRIWIGQMLARSPLPYV